MKQWILNDTYLWRFQIESNKKINLPIFRLYRFVKVMEFNIIIIIQVIRCIVFLFARKQKSCFGNVWPHSVNRYPSYANRDGLALIIWRCTIVMNHQVFSQIKLNKIIFMISGSCHCSVKTLKATDFLFSALNYAV